MAPRCVLHPINWQHRIIKNELTLPIRRSGSKQRGLLMCVLFSYQIVHILSCRHNLIVHVLASHFYFEETASAQKA